MVRAGDMVKRGGFSRLALWMVFLVRLGVGFAVYRPITKKGKGKFKPQYKCEGVHVEKEQVQREGNFGVHYTCRRDDRGCRHKRLCVITYWER